MKITKAQIKEIVGTTVRKLNENSSSDLRNLEKLQVNAKSFINAAMADADVLDNFMDILQDVNKKYGDEYHMTFQSSVPHKNTDFVLTFNMHETPNGWTQSDEDQYRKNSRDIISMISKAKVEAVTSNSKAVHTGMFEITGKFQLRAIRNLSLLLTKH